MKTPAIIALSIIGVLGTTGAAMAVNGATLAAINQGTIGQATDVLVPTSTPKPSPSSTHGSDDDNGLRGDGTVDDDSTSGVPSPSPSHSSDDSGDSYDDSDGREDEVDDDSDDSDDDHSDDSDHDSEDDD
jgi:hypothetical protein